MAHQKVLKLTALLMASTLSSMSYGAGFAIIEQSVTGLGRAFAGSAAVAEDATTIFFNPAGLTYLSHAEIDTAAYYIDPDSKFSDNGSAVPDLGGAGGFSGQALTGGDGGNGVNAIVPNLYYAHPLNDRTVLGLGVTAPFGLVTDYNDTWQGRYHAVKSDLRTFNINPSFAYKATDKLSVGFGVNLQRISVKLTSMADLGALGGSPQAADGKARLEADDWSWGYNLGVIFQATDATRLALAYRSKISHTLTGDGKLRSSTDVVIADEKIKADIDLPETLSFALHHQINDKWAVMGDATWTRWSRFEELNIKSDGSFLGSVKEENWDDSMRYGLGITYNYNDKLTLRAGIAYDETPVKSAQFRTARIADEDRKWVALGASYKYSENITVDAGYTHIFISDTKIDETNDNGYNLNGEYEADVDIFGVQMRWMFL
ncbi:MAG: outer membrane protein transport protein [Piscirickettsiaceae bacterium]|nr:outer membrane protein transport protein [Piscirickettsiaceae bacterium]